MTATKTAMMPMSSGVLPEPLFPAPGFAYFPAMVSTSLIMN
jgi:hypothetical protein